MACASANAVLYVLAALRWGATAELVGFAVLFSTLLEASVIDLEHHRLPDRITFPAMTVATLVIIAATAWTSQPTRLAAALTGGALYWGALGLAHLIHPRGLGRGDVKLAVTLGLCLGWVAESPLDAVLAVLAAFFWASALGTAVGLGLLVRRRRSAPYPFGPWLAAGAVTVLLLSPQLIGS